MLVRLLGFFLLFSGSNLFGQPLVSDAQLQQDRAALRLESAKSAPPNLVLLISDDQGWTDYGFMNHPHVRTPNLDELARRGALFPNGHVPTALCRPSLATIVTGLYAHQHRITGNDPSHSLAAPNSPRYAELREQMIEHIDRLPTLPKLLAQRGYLSHQSGKWWEGNYKRGGFTHGMTRGFPEPGGRHGDDGLTIGRQGMKQVIEFIDHSVQSEKPFFLWYAPFLPHEPHNPPERLLTKYRNQVDSIHVARYYAMCEWFDETAGKVIDHIDQKGQTENTLFIYLSDNGWIQSPEAPGRAERSKLTPFEGGTRQPMIFTWSGTIAPQRRQELISSIDIAPTVLSAAGADIPANLPGKNLLPLLREAKPLERDAIFGETFAHAVADLDQPEESLLYRWVIEGNWKLLLTYDGTDGPPSRYRTIPPDADLRPQLFDLSADPHETKNVAANHPEIVARLAQRIADWWPVAERKAMTEWTE